MVNTIHRVAIVGATAMAALAFVTVVNPGVSSAVECGWGTVFDPPSNTCVAAPAPPPPLPHLRCGTVTSRRTSQWVSARPFHSCLCVRASSRIFAAVSFANDLAQIRYLCQDRR